MDKNEEILVEHVFDKYKYLLLLVGIPLLIAFLRSLVVDLLVKEARKIYSQTQITDDELAKKEADVRAKANDIMDHMHELLNNKPVDENWNK